MLIGGWTSIFTGVTCSRRKSIGGLLFWTIKLVDAANDGNFLFFYSMAIPHPALSD
jgi:hypothetical protein